MIHIILTFMGKKHTPKVIMLRPLVSNPRLISSTTYHPWVDLANYRLKIINIHESFEIVSEEDSDIDNC